MNFCCVIFRVENLDVIQDKYTMFRLVANGHITWNPASIYKVACDADIRYYPLDTQYCHLSLSAWSYTENEVELQFSTMMDAVNLAFFGKNGEWELTTSYGEQQTNGKSRGSQTFSNLYFHMVLRRLDSFIFKHKIVNVINKTNIMIDL